MDIIFTNATINDKEYILNANKEINLLSGLNDSILEFNIDKDLYEDKVCKAIMAKKDGATIGFVLYSYIYWANCGKGIYLSQVYVDKKYRKNGVFKLLLEELKVKEKDCNFITDYVGGENEIMLNAMSKVGFKASELKLYYKMVTDNK